MDLLQEFQGKVGNWNFGEVPLPQYPRRDDGRVGRVATLTEVFS